MYTIVLIEIQYYFFSKNVIKLNSINRKKNSN